MMPLKTTREILVFSIVLLSAFCSYAQFTTIEDAKACINDRLSHSVLQKIDSDGTVTMNAPGEKIRFKLSEVNFNYNGLNNDDRVRVFCDDCIELYEHKQLKEKTSRQSFLCESETEANEAVAAFRFLKKKYMADLRMGVQTDKKLRMADSTLNTRTVGEAIDFINENLSRSMVLGVDERGIMTINAPDDIYKVDLSRAEFGFNSTDNDTKVRIYGDFCIEVKKDHGKKEFLSRQSFQSPGRVNAYKVIAILYSLKSTYTDLDPRSIPGLRNVNGARTDSYKSVSAAIDFINDRLLYSIILGIDKNGVITINSPDNIYCFNLHEAKLSRTEHSNVKSEWFRIPVPFDYAPGILVECNYCIREYDVPGSYKEIEEQAFQCRDMNDVKDVMKALAYIRGPKK